MLTVLGVVAGVLLAAMLFPVVGGTGLLGARTSVSALGNSAELRAGIVPAATTLTDLTGIPIAYLYDQYRIPVPSAQISAAMKASIVAIEDRRFYSHGGVDPIGAAARTYFDTTADKRTVPQAALLAGMVQSPADDDPVQHPAAALDRRNTVVEQLRRQGSITDAQAAAAAAPLGIVPNPSAPGEGCTGVGDAGYFCAYALAYLERSGITADQLRNGGYTIRTILDSSALASLKAAVDGQVPPMTPHVADVMSVVAPGADAHRVVAMAANRTYGTGPGESRRGLPSVPENLDAGSVYKVFTAAAALEQGIVGIDSVVDVPPTGYTSPSYLGASGTPIPVGNVGDYPPKLSLTDALAQSPNTAFVGQEERTGVPPVVDMAERLGLTSLATTPASDEPGAPSVGEVARSRNQGSFTLGVFPTSDLELANVMATLAGHGTWCPPTPIESVTDRDGRPVAVPQPPCRQALDPAIADTLMNGLSRDDQPGGTSATAAAATGWNRPIATKTGTTQDDESAAFAGATPQLAGASGFSLLGPSPA